MVNSLVGPVLLTRRSRAFCADTRWKSRVNLIPGLMRQRPNFFQMRVRHQTGFPTK
jgi:hypothetical protein